MGTLLSSEAHQMIYLRRCLLGNIFYRHRYKHRKTLINPNRMRNTSSEQYVIQQLCDIFKHDNEKKSVKRIKITLILFG